MLKGPEGDNMSQERYDNYLTKLQNICTENVGEEGKPVYETMKSAIQVFFFSQVKVLTFFTFSEHVGPSHGHLKPQPSILKAECNISWFLLDV